MQMCPTDGIHCYWIDIVLSCCLVVLTGLLAKFNWQLSKTAQNTAESARLSAETARNELLMARRPLVYVVWDAEEAEGKLVVRARIAEGVGVATMLYRSRVRLYWEDGPRAEFQDAERDCLLYQSHLYAEATAAIRLITVLDGESPVAKAGLCFTFSAERKLDEEWGSSEEWFSTATISYGKDKELIVRGQPPRRGAPD